jgi:hypothetical protein
MIALSVIDDLLLTCLAAGEFRRGDQQEIDAHEALAAIKRLAEALEAITTAEVECAHMEDQFAASIRWGGAITEGLAALAAYKGETP